MTRAQVATVLGVVASLMVVATVVVALTSYSRQDGGRPAAASEPLLVRDRASGAGFTVPGAGWTLTGPRARIYYADDRGRPAALVRGAAVFRKGYCAARPRGSNRGFAGFTRQPFAVWTRALAEGGGAVPDGVVSRSTVRLADGSLARLSTVRMSTGHGGRCAAPGLVIGMVEAAAPAHHVRLVLVRDTSATGALTDDEARAVLTSLTLAAP